MLKHSLSHYGTTGGVSLPTPHPLTSLTHTHSSHSGDGTNSFLRDRDREHASHLQQHEHQRQLHQNQQSFSDPTRYLEGHISPTHAHTHSHNHSQSKSKLLFFFKLEIHHNGVDQVSEFSGNTRFSSTPQSLSSSRVMFWMFERNCENNELLEAVACHVWSQGDLKRLIHLDHRVILISCSHLPGFPCRLKMFHNKNGKYAFE